MVQPPDFDSVSGTTGAEAGPRRLKVCVIGLGGGGFHWEAQRLIQSVKRPLDLVLVYAGPGGGLMYWESKDAIRSRHIVRSPSLMGDGAVTKVAGLLRNVWQAFSVLRTERPDVVLASGTAQAIPFAVAARVLGVRVWFLESVTRAVRPSRTAQMLHRMGIARLYYYWATLTPFLPTGICMEDVQR